MWLRGGALLLFPFVAWSINRGLYPQLAELVPVRLLDPVETDRAAGSGPPGDVMTRSVYLETMGCQMNVLDSELVMGQLRALGYEPTTDTLTADVVLLNTCSVRQHAEDKVLSRLGELRRRKQDRPDLIVGVIGCMAERDGPGILKAMPHVDLLCGPGELNRLPALLVEATEARRRAVATSSEHSRATPAAERAQLFDSIEALDRSRSPAPGAGVLQSYIRVQRGCDKFCTFCVVPFTRGPERSRPPQAIVDEARMLADRGAKEITLLGQTVNSYVHNVSGRTVRFAELLERVHDVPGIERLRFVTSSPSDFTVDILEAMRDLDRVCEYLHLPVQSGSDAVLRRMQRSYSMKHYLHAIDACRERIPDLGLATDFIVGFCGETDEEFDASVRLMEDLRFQGSFVFRYSERSGTVAADLPDDVPDAVKRERNQVLLELQKRISLEENRKAIGSTVEVLVDSVSKQDKGRWSGRNRRHQIVVFPRRGDEDLVG